MISSEVESNLTIISVEQAGQYLPQHVSHSTRIAAASWCLTSVVLVYLYSGCLISFMTVPKFRPLVETLDELADHKELQIATLDTHFFQSMLLVRKYLASSFSLICIF